MVRILIAPSTPTRGIREPFVLVHRIAHEMSGTLLNVHREHTYNSLFVQANRTMVQRITRQHEHTQVTDANCTFRRSALEGIITSPLLTAGYELLPSLLDPTRTTRL